MAYNPISYYSNLTGSEVLNAQALRFTPYNGSVPGYDNAAQYSASYAGAEQHAVFSFTAVAGAVYSLQSTSYNDPHTLLVFDNAGRPIIEDDGSGITGQDHLSFVALYSGTYYVDAGWVQGNFSSQQAVGLSILEDRATLHGFNLDGTQFGEDIDGTSGNDNIFGYGGRDSLFGGRGDDYLDGGTGLDEAYYQGTRAEYSVKAYGDRFMVKDLYGSDGSDLLSNIERISFKDMDVGLDINGSAGEAYRLYQAAFNRTPDKGGLGYWIAQMDRGVDVFAVADAFVNSNEFRSIYGAQPSNQTIVTGFYHNVLHRAPDQGGLDYWLNILNAKQASVAGVLASFSESEENYAALLGVMSNGIEFQHWG